MTREKPKVMHTREAETSMSDTESDYGLMARYRGDRQARLIVKKDGEQMEALLDSGAEISIIDSELIDIREVNSVPGKIKGINGETTRIIGEKEVSIAIKSIQGFVEQHHQFKIMDNLRKNTGYAVLLGADLIIQKWAADVSYCRGELTTGGITFPIIIGEIEQFGVRYTEEDARLTLTDGVEDVTFGPNISNDDRRKLTELLDNNKDAFLTKGAKLGVTSRTQHSIKLTDTKPICRRQKSWSAKEHQIIEKHVTRMLEAGVVKDSSSDYNFNISLAPKKGTDELRFCVNFIPLNKVTVFVAFPIPNMADCFDMFTGAKYFSTMDLASGYWQIPMAADSIKYCAFSTSTRHLEFNVMPFGLKCAPATFQRLMNEIFADLIGKGVYIYLDDIIIYSGTIERHLELIKEVLERLKRANLRAKPSKCKILVTRVPILGHIVEDGVLRPDSERIRAIVELPRPINSKEVQRFIGLTGFLRSFLPNCSRVVAPLSEIIGKRQSFKWGKEQEEAFRLTKRMLISSPVLQLYNEKLPVVIDTDASIVGIGAALLQPLQQMGKSAQMCADVNGAKYAVVRYYSRKLVGAELRYPIQDLECLAVVEALRVWHKYAHGKELTIRTDSKSLSFILGRDDKVRGRYVNWQMRLSEYDFKTVHRRGKYNYLCDLLSRAPVEQEEVYNNDGDIAADDVLIINMSDDNIRQEQSKDEACVKIKSDMKFYEKNGFYNDNGIIKRTMVRNGVKIGVVVLPKKMFVDIMYELHDSILAGHPAVDAVLDAFRCRFWMPRAAKMIEDYVRSCHTCQTTNTARKSGVMIPLPVPINPFERVYIDCAGPFTRSKSGAKYYVAVVDAATRWLIMAPLSEIKADKVVSFFLREVVLKFGIPWYIHSDNGSEFKNNLFKEMVDKLNSTHKFSTSYHPQSQGYVERVNGTVKKIIRKYVDNDQRNWSDVIPYVQFAYNCTMNSTTKFSPYELLFGRLPVLPFEVGIDYSTRGMEQSIKNMQEWNVIARRNTEDRQSTNLHNYNRRHVTPKFRVGDQVLVRNNASKVGLSTKLLPKWKPNPLKIIKMINDKTAVLEGDEGSEIIVSSENMKLYRQREMVIDKVKEKEIKPIEQQEELIKRHPMKTRSSNYLSWNYALLLMVSMFTMVASEIDGRLRPFVHDYNDFRRQSFFISDYRNASLYTLEQMCMMSRLRIGIDYGYNIPLFVNMTQNGNETAWYRVELCRDEGMTETLILERQLIGVKMESLQPCLLKLNATEFCPQGMYLSVYPGIEQAYNGTNERLVEYNERLVNENREMLKEQRIRMLETTKLAKEGIREAKQAIEEMNDYARSVEEMKQLVRIGLLILTTVLAVIATGVFIMICRDVSRHRRRKSEIRQNIEATEMIEMMSLPSTQETSTVRRGSRRSLPKWMWWCACLTVSCMVMQEGNPPGTAEAFKMMMPKMMGRTMTRSPSWRTSAGRSFKRPTNPAKAGYRRFDMRQASRRVKMARSIRLRTKMARPRSSRQTLTSQKKIGPGKRIMKALTTPKTLLAIGQVIFDIAGVVYYITRGQYGEAVKKATKGLMKISNMGDSDGLSEIANGLEEITSKLKEDMPRYNDDAKLGDVSVKYTSLKGIMDDVKEHEGVTMTGIILLVTVTIRFIMLIYGKYLSNKKNKTQKELDKLQI